MREQYIQIRSNAFEAVKNKQNPIIPMDFFYRYYLQEFEKQPKSRLFYKKDRFGGLIFDVNNDVIWEEVTTTQLPPQIFSQQFGMLLMGYFEDIMTVLDKVFNVSWLEDSQGNKIKLVV